MLRCEVFQGEVATMARINVHHNKPADRAGRDADIGGWVLVPPPPNLGLVSGGVLQSVGRARVFANFVAPWLAARAATVDGGV